MYFKIIMTGDQDILGPPELPTQREDVSGGDYDKLTDVSEAPSPPVEKTLLARKATAQSG